MEINKKETVKEQYKTSVNLDIRISIHQKYSTNKQGFGNWILQQYDVRDNYKIIELGCGKGELWNEFRFPNDVQIIQTDFSEGMMIEAKKNSTINNVVFKQVDIQNIPYNDKEFDMVVANMMLYHVPDLDKGLEEVVRVLKNGSNFYTTTYGENGITEYVQSLLNDNNLINSLNKTFTLQNGKGILSKYFSKVELRQYEDSLEVTNTNDLIDYIFSMSSVIGVEYSDKARLFEMLESKKVNGKIIVPKEYGIFICTK